MLSIKNFSKHYQGRCVLSIAELKLPTGIHWVKGQNGAGKTTLFKSLAGMLPHEGDIQFDDGINLKSHPVEFRKYINYGEAEPLYPEFLTGKDLVNFIGKIKGADQAQQNNIINAFDIQSFFKTPIQSYSSGMIKKLSLVLSFLGKPRLIILDEPLITLDIVARQALTTLIREKIKVDDVTFLISSHELINETDLQINNEYLIQNKTLTLV